MSEAEKYEADTARMIAADKAKWAAIRDTDHAAAMFEDRARSAATDWMYVSPMGDPVATLAIEVNAAHAEALVEYRRVLAGRRLDRACVLCGPGADHSNRGHDFGFDQPDPARLKLQVEDDHAAALEIDRDVYPLLRGMGAPDRMRLQVGDDHAQALLDNLACELCGRRELHPNHRGIGHTHTPAEDPQGRARALLARLVGVPALVVPEYVYETARMMLDSQNADMDVVAYDRIEAEADDGIRSAIADQSPWTPVRELDHPAHPHLLDPGKCTHCSRPIFVRYDAHGGFESASHYA